MSSERRIEPDLKTARRSNFSQASPDLTTHVWDDCYSGCFLSSSRDLSLSDSLSNSSSGGVDGFCTEEEMARMKGKG